jgi:hypothetical protein
MATLTSKVEIEARCVYLKEKREELKRDKRYLLSLVNQITKVHTSAVVLVNNDVFELCCSTSNLRVIDQEYMDAERAYSCVIAELREYESPLKTLLRKTLGNDCAHLNDVNWQICTNVVDLGFRDETDPLVRVYLALSNLRLIRREMAEVWAAIDKLDDD